MIKKYNANLVKMVTLLQDGEYHDGTTLGEKLHMTRSAIWKAIKKLEKYDIKIASIKGKGYALLEPLVLLDLAKIKKNAKVDKIAIDIFETIDSTNTYLQSLKKNKKIKFCLAEQQLQGKGRLNRNWHSPFGRNIYLSCFYPFQKDVSELSGLSLVISLVIAHTLKEYGLREQLSVKWPNDVIYNNKKISGCLISIQAETHGSSNAVIGIGININMPLDDKHITQAYTSLQSIVNTYIDRNEFAGKLIMYLLDYLDRFNAQGFVPFMQEWIQADYLLDQSVCLKNLEQKIEGVAIGINELGHLLLSLPDGSVRAFSAGDTTIIKR